MRNSYEKCLQGLYHAILTDYVRSVPTYHREMERDMSRIHSLVDSNGLAFLTLALPQMGKHFDLSLANGRLESSGVMGFKPYRRNTTIPCLFKGMWIRVFDSEGVLRDDPDITSILFLRQLLFAAKKLRITCDDSRTRKTVQEFFRLDLSLRLPSLDWGGDRLDGLDLRDVHLIDGQPESRDPGLFDLGSNELENPYVLETIQRTADVVSTSLGWFDPSEWRAKHGPGAVSDGRVGNFHKYDFPTWPRKLDAQFPMDEFAFANASSWVDHLDGCRDGSLRDREDPSKLIAVPKTQKGPRLIASEPTANQWTQQTVCNFLMSKVADTPISSSVHYHDQTYNQRAARQASLDGKHWTIDLSSASDCVSLWLVERIFRRNHPLLNAFHATRTKYVKNEITAEPALHMLRKFTTMGAATTFPTQSIIYTIVCIGVMLHELGLSPNSKNIAMMSRQVQVFGDDIVAPSAVGPSIVKVLAYLGFQVNPSKTFGTGKFRESCGVECYDGHDVTPAYFLDIYDKSRPSTVSTLVESSNNFFMKGFWVTAEWIKSTLPPLLQQKLPVVGTVSGQFGLRSFSGVSLNHLKSRWNEAYQREEVQALTPSSKVTWVQPDTDACLLQYFTEEPSPDTQWASGYGKRPITDVRYRWVPSRAYAA